MRLSHSAHDHLVEWKGFLGKKNGVKNEDCEEFRVFRVNNVGFRAFFGVF
jgi:hypothetical protein